MNNYIAGKTIKLLREKKGLTQIQLATILDVSDKTISKWETGRGLPDITLLEPLAKALSVSVIELMAGECVVNKNISGNMTKCNFYVCPACGNIVYSMGEGLVSCCGVTLPVLGVEDSDDEHKISIEKIEDEYYISINHPMTKRHYVSFIASVSCDKIEIVKVYPEGNAETRFFIRNSALIYAYCNKHGLFRIKQAIN